MNNTLKKLVKSENKKFIALILIFIGALILSALIYSLTGKGSLSEINYESISKMNFLQIFGSSIKRNIIYFLAVIFLTYFGQGYLTMILFGFISVYYGLSVIYIIRTVGMDLKYFMITFTDYFIFFPILLYFTFISSSIAKYTKKAKNIETISRKFDIIISGYLRISLFYLLIVTAYSFVYSLYVLILSRLMVR
ncbi:MAG: hypothetical protein GX867_07350 [Tissierellia bacterium]|jgi:hypothetical protein|nr:hypothetical protein [Tissierellia bacterium]HOT21537.1 hypothetical protein [Sedimentibacter sp.]